MAGGVSGGGGGCAWQGGHDDRGPVWQVGEHAWLGGCVAGGGMCSRGGMCGRGHAWQGGCMVGVFMAGGHVWDAHPPGRYYKIGAMSGQYASYWNAFLF